MLIVLLFALVVVIIAWAVCQIPNLSGLVKTIVWLLAALVILLALVHAADPSLVRVNV